MPDFLETGPSGASWTLLCGHGAGGGMETPFMTEMVGLLGERDVRVLRFEVGYMAAARAGGKRRPPPKAETLTAEYRAAVFAARETAAPARLAIGGKSMGGRVASLVADELLADGAVNALVCLGYPFHPPGMPEKTRTAHLAALRCPAVFVQGERDPFGSRSEAQGYALASAIGLAWMGDGDHDFGPRGASGFTRKGNLAAAADATAAFLANLG